MGMPRVGVLTAHEHFFWVVFGHVVGIVGAVPKVILVYNGAIG